MRFLFTIIVLLGLLPALIACQQSEKSSHTTKKLPVHQSSQDKSRHKRFAKKKESSSKNDEKAINIGTVRIESVTRVVNLLKQRKINVGYIVGLGNAGLLVSRKRAAEARKVLINDAKKNGYWYD